MIVSAATVHTKGTLTLGLCHMFIQIYQQNANTDGSSEIQMCTQILNEEKKQKQQLCEDYVKFDLPIATVYGIQFECWII